MSLTFTTLKYTPFRTRYIPKAPGIYRILVNGSVRYVGKSNSLRTRYEQHLDERFNMALRALIINSLTLCFEYATVYDKGRLEPIEIKYIAKHVDSVMGIQHQHVH